jgi:two-component system chemotaxis response regulator CheY
MSSKRILIVDDAQFMRFMIGDIVKSLGHAVVSEAENGKIGVEMYKQFKPDLVTMDLVMPEMNGLDALKAIREIDPKARIIVVSAIDQRESLMQAIRAGAADFIIKPFEEERVASAITKTLGG